MELAALITGIASAVALVGTLLLVARQARSLASQTELANKLAALSANDIAIRELHVIVLVFVDHPRLRRYFYENVELPDEESELHDDVRGRVFTIAESLIDTLERALQSIGSVGVPARDRRAWEDAIDFYLANSPPMRTTITAHPSWWPSLDERLLRLTAAAHSDTADLAARAVLA